PPPLSRRIASIRSLKRRVFNRGPLLALQRQDDLFLAVYEAQTEARVRDIEKSRERASPATLPLPEGGRNRCSGLVRQVARADDAEQLAPGRGEDRGARAGVPQLSGELAGIGVGAAGRRAGLHQLRGARVDGRVP